MCEEEPLAAEESRLYPADEFDVVCDGFLESNQAAGINPKRLAGRKLDLVHGPSGVNECKPVAGKALEDESLAAEEAGP